ncbi:uncharacterized [Tachysurus ichikawai]
MAEVELPGFPVYRADQAPDIYNNQDGGGVLVKSDSKDLQTITSYELSRKLLVVTVVPLEHSSTQFKPQEELVLKINDQ